MKWARTLDAALGRLENGLLALALATLIGLSVLQIGLRNLAGTSWYWIDPFTRMLVLWLAVLGAMVATRQGEHISMDAVRRYLSGLPRQITELMASGFAALVTGLMAWHSARFVYEEWIYGATAFAGLPAWPFQLIMPLGFALIALRFAIRTLIAATGRTGG